MFEGLCIFVPGSCSVVDNEKLALFLPGANHDVLRFDLIVDKIFEVEVLQDGDEFLAEHEDGLLGESSTTQLLKFLH